MACMQNQEDTDVYLTRFEQQMTAYQVPRTDWMLRLLTLLAGLALAAYRVLSSSESTEYNIVKNAVLRLPPYQVLYARQAAVQK